MSIYLEKSDNHIIDSGNSDELLGELRDTSISKDLICNRESISEKTLFVIFAPQVIWNETSQSNRKR